MYLLYQRRDVRMHLVSHSCCRVSSGSCSHSPALFATQVASIEKVLPPWWCFLREHKHYSFTSPTCFQLVQRITSLAWRATPHHVLPYASNICFILYHDWLKRNFMIDHLSSLALWLQRSAPIIKRLRVQSLLSESSLFEGRKNMLHISACRHSSKLKLP